MCFHYSVVKINLFHTVKNMQTALNMGFYVAYFSIVAAGETQYAQMCINIPFKNFCCPFFEILWVLPGSLKLAYHDFVTSQSVLSRPSNQTADIYAIAF